MSHMQYVKIVQLECKQDLYIMTESHMHRNKHASFSVDS